MNKADRLQVTLEAMHHAAKIASMVDFTSDMAEWPDQMIHAYLNGNAVEAECRKILAATIFQELTNGAEAL